ncbi:MAG: hypothetical protein IV100_11585 [Myxococcales bacterium]|nr:hypothetical protein [Myxococcales bacterium]
MKDSAGLFEVRLTDKVEIRAVTTFASADVATKVKGLLDALLISGADAIKAMGGTPTITQDDKRVTITVSIPLPDLSKLPM